MKIIIDKNLIDLVDLSDLKNIITRTDHKEIINAPAGVRHYKLLAYLASQIDGDILELGTHHGTSCLALSKYTEHKIATWDIKDFFSLKECPENVERHIGDILKDVVWKKKMLEFPLIFLDTTHDGEFESEVYKHLSNKYDGVLLLDDIHLNRAMKRFWENITHKKYDITRVGHGLEHGGVIPGTGLVDFGGNVEVVEDYSVKL